MCGFQKVLKKEKNVEKIVFFFVWFQHENKEKKSNIIKINQKFIHFKII